VLAKWRGAVARRVGIMGQPPWGNLNGTACVGSAPELAVTAAPCTSAALWPRQAAPSNCCELTGSCKRIPFLLHVQKAGGSTMCAIAHHSNRRVPPVSPPWSNCNSRQVAELWHTLPRTCTLHRHDAFCLLAHEALRAEGTDLISWELPLQPFDARAMLCPRFFRYVLVLREPITRIASWLRFSNYERRNNISINARISELRRQETPRMFGTVSEVSVAHRMGDFRHQISQFDNLFVRSLIGATGHDAALWVDWRQVGRDHLERARFLARFLEVLILEDFSEPSSVASLSSIFGAAVQHDPHVNARPQAPGMDPLAPLNATVVKLLRELNQPDIALYTELRKRSK
jgi:hypothetical protein